MIETQRRKMHVRGCLSLPFQPLPSSPQTIQRNTNIKEIPLRDETQIILLLFLALSRDEWCKRMKGNVKEGVMLRKRPFHLSDLRAVILFIRLCADVVLTRHPESNVLENVCFCHRAALRCCCCFFKNLTMHTVCVT